MQIRNPKTYPWIRNESKIMKPSEIRDLRPDERIEKLGDLQKQLFSLRSQAVTENLENRHAIRNVRRDIARIKTIIRQDQLKGQ